MSDGCVFCSIISGELPSYKIYEDEQIMVILDAFPSSPGHALILPKEHTPDTYDVDPSLHAKVYAMVPRVAKAVREYCGCDGVNVLQNNGAIAGQTIPHLHVHVIPRYIDDAVSIKWNMAKPSHDEQNAAAEGIKKQMEGIL